MFAECPRGLGVNYDPSHLVRIGIDYIRMLNEFAAHVVHVHGKDTDFDQEALYLHGNLGPSFHASRGFGEDWWRYTIPGDGVVDWLKVVQRLEDEGFDGIISVETRRLPLLENLGGRIRWVEAFTRLPRTICTVGAQLSCPTLKALEGRQVLREKARNECFCLCPLSHSLTCPLSFLSLSEEHRKNSASSASLRLSISNRTEERNDTMIIDSHAYCFEPADSPRGYASSEEHLKWVQASHAVHHQPAFRIRDRALGPSDVLAPEGRRDLSNLPDVRFRN